MTWLLDTNVVIHAQRGDTHVRARLLGVSPDDVAISAVTVAELWYGAARSNAPDRKQQLWARVLEPYQLLAFDRAAAETHGRIRFVLRHEPVGERDLLIASIALAQDLTVVTANKREFDRVPDLRVEDWSAG